MWDKPPSLFGDVVERAAVERVQDIASDLYPALVAQMPVDTTQAVSNLNVALDAADWKFVEGKTIGRSGALAEGMSVINSMPKDKLHNIYITSAVPYMGDLEQGSSRQAPNGVFDPVFLAVATYYK